MSKNSFPFSVNKCLLKATFKGHKCETLGEKVHYSKYGFLY